MKNKYLSKHVLYLAVFTAFTAFAMISLQSYRKLTEEKTEVGRGMSLKLLDPELESGVLDRIEARSAYSFSDIKDIEAPKIEEKPLDRESRGETSTPSAQPQGGDVNGPPEGNLLHED